MSNKKKPTWKSAAAGTLALLMIGGNLPARVYADDTAGTPGSYSTDGQTGGFTIENGVLTSYTGSSKNVIIPDGVKVIGDGSPSVFGNEIESVTIPASVTEIADYAFYGCSGLKSVTFAEGSELKKIGDSAFYAANSLETLTIPEGVTEIGTNAFCATNALSEINLPASLTTVCGGDWFGKLFAFGNEYNNAPPQNLTAVNFTDGGNYTSHDGAVYSADGKTLIYCPAAKKSINWLSGVESIASYAFNKSTISWFTIRFIRKNQQYLLPNARKYDIIISSSITTRQATQ